MEQNVIKTVIDDLIIKRNNISLQFKQIEEAIEALQNVCEHKFYPDHPEHPNYEKCIYCGKEQKT